MTFGVLCAQSLRSRFMWNLGARFGLLTLNISNIVSPFVKRPTLIKAQTSIILVYMNIMPLTPSLTCSLIPARGESKKPNRVLHGLSNQQMGNKLQRDGSNLGPPPKPNSNTMLNDRLS